MRHKPSAHRWSAGPGVQDVERYKAALSRPHALSAAIHYYRAALRTSTKWHIPAAERQACQGDQCMAG